jgi:hypothetical protein
LRNLTAFWVKNANFFAIFVVENISEIITSIPGSSSFHSFFRLIENAAPVLP